jgi:hypothetical protein
LFSAADLLMLRQGHNNLASLKKDLEEDLLKKRAEQRKKK